MADPEFQRTVRLSEVPRGQMRVCRIGEREIVLCHTREGVFALSNVCTHAEARMNEGRLRGLSLICPLHGASFDVRDGRVLSAPATQSLPHHAVRVVDDFVEVAIDSTRNRSTSA